MPRQPLTAAILAVLSASACFSDPEPVADCTPGSAACGCDEGTCAPGLSCLNTICGAGPGSTTASTPTAGPSGTSITVGTTHPGDTTDDDGTGADTGTTSGDTSLEDTSASAADSTASSSGGERHSHVIFTSQERFVGGEIGSLEAADVLCEQASPTGTPHRAILSDTKRTPPQRITIAGPVFNTLGELVAANAEELWSGQASAEVGFDEYGDPTPETDLAWVGSAKANCEDWGTDVFDEVGAFGVPGEMRQWLMTGQMFQCGLSLHIYCISL